MVFGVPQSFRKADSGQKGVVMDLLAFDLDGTVTQHRSPIEEKNLRLLQSLQKQYKIVFVGAGACGRIAKQIAPLQADIIGNYGLQVTRFENNQLIYVRNSSVKAPEKKIIGIINDLRKKTDYTEFKGDSVEFHTSGIVTFPLLGTKADIEDKLRFDPDRQKRRKWYAEVKSGFQKIGYTAFIGGSSSYDMAPDGCNKRKALKEYCDGNGILYGNAVYFGDDFEEGGNDESLVGSEFKIRKVDNYLRLDEVVFSEIGRI